MSAIAAKPGANAGSFQPIPSVIAIVIAIILVVVAYFLGSSGILAGGAQFVLQTFCLIILGAALIAFGVHFVPVGGAPAAMGQAPGIATGVAMLATGAGLAGLFGGAWAAELGLGVALASGAIGGALMMAITCLMVNISYVFGMGIPAASGKVLKDPITGDLQAAYKSQGTEGHGLPFISYVGGVIGGLFGGLGGTLIYIQLLDFYNVGLPALGFVGAADINMLSVGLAGIFAIGMFLVIAVLSAYNITGTIEGPHDPKFKRFPRAIVAAILASAVCGLVAMLVVALF
ncbi:MAG: tetrahydromethanopterin S-methyltransferase subunit D [Methanocorpusculum sp.]|uniref:tetrahydromethanopterin S-methyltransferase subunit D n=1 Tax=Methanocorpusculum sp. TaxID=2058474 RepID=UPI00271969E4|nr:tetrahydromethanopterin S-methyltransferase subunit D [Methanocorpusculum sp.]MDO9522188.1 tetrahydromethanopterin S-methyltransferase subunit D [Methanocorpusculum sp.]